MFSIATFLFAFAKTNPNLRPHFAPRYRNLTRLEPYAVRETFSFQHTTLEALIQKTTVIRGALARCDMLSETALKIRHETTATCNPKE